MTDHRLAVAHREALLYSAFIYFRNWDYSSAVAPLKRFLKLVPHDPYALLLGKTNLAAALVASERATEALTYIGPAIDEAKKNQFRLLHGNLLEIQAQAYVISEQWPEGIRSLIEAREFHQNSSPLNTLLLDKWDAYIALNKGGYTKSVKTTLDNLRARALTLKHFETIRQVDLYEARVTKDQDLLNKLYFGAGSDGFRKILIKQIGNDYVPPHDYIFHINYTQEKAKGKCLIDLQSGELTINRDSRAASEKKIVRILKPGQILHRFIYSFAKDFYRPPTLGFLFQELYRDEPYDPAVVSHRVHQILYRTRKNFNSHDCAIQFVEKNSRYFMESSFALNLKIPNNFNLTTSNPDKTQLKTASWLHKLSIGTDYSLRDLLHTSQMGRSSLFEEIKIAEAAGIIQKSKRGLRKSYRRIG